MHLFQPVPAGGCPVHHRARRARRHVRGGRGRAGGAAGRAPRAVVGVERGGDVYGGRGGRRSMGVTWVVMNGCRGVDGIVATMRSGVFSKN